MGAVGKNGLPADAGITFNGPLSNRPNDKFGLGVAYARISERARELDRDFQLFTGVQRVIRDSEMVFAATYWALLRLRRREETIR